MGPAATRADAAKHGGDYRKIVEGVNQTLDAVIGPLNVAAEYVDRISKGDIPPKITDKYNGDFNEIKNNLNVCIDALTTLVQLFARHGDAFRAHSPALGRDQHVGNLEWPRGRDPHLSVGELAVLTDQFHPAGVFETAWYPDRYSESLHSGQYFLRMQAGAFSAVQKIASVVGTVMFSTLTRCNPRAEPGSVAREVGEGERLGT